MLPGIVMAASSYGSNYVIRRMIPMIWRRTNLGVLVKTFEISCQSSALQVELKLQPRPLRPSFLFLSVIYTFSAVLHRSRRPLQRSTYIRRLAVR